MGPDTSPIPKPRPSFPLDANETSANAIESLLEAIWPAWSGAGSEPRLAIYAGAAILAALLIAGGVVLLRKSRRRPCRWEKAPAKMGTGSTRWICRTFGIDAFSHDGRPPKECKRALRPWPL